MRPLLLCFFLLVTISLSAQSYRSRIHYKVKMGDSSQLHQLILLDYTKLLGTALEVKADSLYFLVRSASTASAIPLRELRYLGVFVVADSQEDRQRAYQEFPDFSDMTYERTALPFSGKGQVRAINAIYGVVEWNLNDNAQVGVGLAGPLGVLLTQKLRFSITPDLHVGLAGQQLWLPLINTFSRRTIVLGDVGAIVTVGNQRRFANFGTGIFFNTEFGDPVVPMHRFGIGGQVGERWHIYGELLMSRDQSTRFSQLNLFPSLNASLGVRRHRWQFGIFTVFADEDNFFPPPLPYVGYSYYW